MSSISLQMTEKYAYDLFIKECRKDIKKSREVKFSLSASLSKVLDNFNGVTTEPINWSSLNSFPLDEWIHLNEKVEIRKTLSSKNLLIFDTIMVQGGNFGWHKHDDCKEECVVVSGILKDVEHGVKYEKGDTAVFEKGIEHTPVALEDSILIVKFTR